MMDRRVTELFLDFPAGSSLQWPGIDSGSRIVCCGFCRSGDCCRHPRRDPGEKTGMGGDPVRDAVMNTLPSIVASAALLTLPAEAQDHRFEADPVVTVRENFVACDVLSQLQRVMDDPRFLLTGECEPLSAGRRVRIYAIRGTRSRRANGPTRKCCRNRPSNAPAVTRKQRRIGRVCNRGARIPAC